jgi:hypothetical protein
MQGKVVKVQPIPHKEPKPVDADRLCEELCYWYPAYRFEQARQVPYKRSVSMLRTARRLEAEKYYQLTQIAAAPHTDKGDGVKNLLKAYGDTMHG